MKKLIVTVLGLVLSIGGLASCNRPGLVIANWGMFLSDELVADFEREHGISVSITNYASNSEAITLERNNRFDIVIPSEYAVEELARANRLNPINWELLAELGLEKNDFHGDMMQHVNVQEFELLNYGVPYKWGVLGILYNEDIEGLSEALISQQWNIFNYQEWDGPNLRVGLYDSAIDAIAAGLASAGRDISSNNETYINEAFQWVESLIELHGAYLTLAGDEFHQHGPAGELDIIQKFSGCATFILWNTMEANADRNDADRVNLNFFVPDSTNLFVNSMVIPRRARNVEMAHKFIAFVSQHDNAVTNTMATFYTSAIQSAYDYVMGIENQVFGDQRSDTFGFFPYFGLASTYAPTIESGHVFFQYHPGRRQALHERWIFDIIS